MRRRLVLLGLAVMALGAAPAAVGQAPGEDSAVGQVAAGPGCEIPENCTPYGSFDFSARSGPSGENPAGQMINHIGGGSAPTFRGEVTCLRVTGNRAVVGSFGVLNYGGGMAFEIAEWTRVVDGGGPGSLRDTVQNEDVFDAPPPTDCSRPPVWRTEVFTVASGDIVVRDAPSLPGTLFGKTTAGAAFAALDHNDKYASPFGFFSSTPATVTKLRAYLDGKGRQSGSQLLRGLIYRNTPSGPGALVAASSPVTIRAGRAAGWVDFPFPAPPTLQGAVYWLSLHAGDSDRVARYAYDEKPGGQRRNDDAFSNGPSNPFGGSDKSRREISIQAVGR